MQKVYARSFLGRFVAISSGVKKKKYKSTARISLAKYFIPRCVGRGLDLDLKVSWVADAEELKNLRTHVLFH